MPISPFVFSSNSLAKLKAKQLAKTFPFLKLSTAQEATARALGYSSWYECTKLGKNGTLSPTDQAAGMAVRVGRYYHQTNVLINLGITPNEADRWVRAWGLTGAPTLAPEEAKPLYYVWNDAITAFERGEISEDDFLDKFGLEWESKYPHIDRPMRVCDGVIIGPMGKYPHYAVDPAINARIPIYLRGPYSEYHCEDGADVLAACVKDFPRKVGRPTEIRRLSHVQFEWFHGVKHPNEKAELIPGLIAAALKHAGDLIIIAQRAMPVPNRRYDHRHYALACLRGEDYAAFLKDKGVVNSDAVVWFKDIDEAVCLSNQTDHLEMSTEEPMLPVFMGADKYQPCNPIYSYPFMYGAMSEDESMFGEWICLLPLDQDYEPIADDDDGDYFNGDDDGPDGTPSLDLARFMPKLEPA